MSKNISIQEGGQGKAFGRISKLKIAQSGGGETLWVPEDEVQTKSLYVSKNGTYYASSENVYGYDEVDVNITNGVTYTDDDVDYYIGVDDDGYLEEPEELPMYIEITTPPNKLEYISGEPINSAGMVVTAYYADGSVYGVIPREEYLLVPPIADESKVAAYIVDGKPAHYDCTRNGRKYYSTAPYAVCNSINDTLTFEGTTLSFSYDTNRKYCNYHVNGGTASGSRWLISDTFPLTVVGKVEVINGKTTLPAIVARMAKASTASNYDMYLFRKATYEEGSNLQTIEVVWEREDGEELKDDFEVHVSSIIPSTNDSGGGGSSGGSW